MRGMEACIISHHINVILRNLARYLPRKIFVARARAETIIISIAKYSAGNGATINKFRIYMVVCCKKSRI
jgi:hypothetical protein